MRLLSARLRNYRIHGEYEVEFDPARTLVGGPNETGKSTLIEAIHRALFLRGRTGGEVQKRMVSTRHPGVPEVELRFEAGGRTYHVHKRFAGPQGSTRLSDDTGFSAQDDEAESRLVQLLGVEELQGGRGLAERLSKQWAHLWVWQGEAGDDPAAHATAEQSRLIQRLQALGGAAALQSDLDARVARHFAEAHDSIFAQTGRPKAMSDLAKAEQALTLAQAELAQATERVQNLEHAAAELESASRDLATATDNLKTLHQEQQAVESRLHQLATLRQREIEEKQSATTAADRQAGLETADRKILTTRREVAALEQALAPKTDQLRRLELAHSEHRQCLVEAESKCRATADAVRAARLRHDLAAAQFALFEKATLHARLTEKAQAVASRRQAVAELKAQLALLPDLTRSGLAKLQKLESQCATAAAALQAMAAGLEVLASDQPVLAGDTPLPPGQHRILTEDTEVRIGDAIRLRIQPGGGTSLAEARAAERTARRKLQDALDAFGLASVQAASETQARREDLKSRQQKALAELDGMGADQLEAELQTAHDSLAAARGNADRLQALVADSPSPADATAAKTLRDAAQETLQQAEEAEGAATSARDAGAQTLASRETDLTRHRQELEQQQRQLNDLQAQLRLLLDTHGLDAARLEALSQAQQARTLADAALQTTRNAIAALQPDLLETDRSRLARAITQKTNERGEAQTRIAVARNTLRSEGAEDPRAALAAAQARARTATALHEAQARRAKAIARLHQLFQDQQRALAAQFTSPLADRISGYLQCLFGPDTRAQITLEQNGFTGLRLFRPGADGAAASFDELSGGAREQLAAAVRLAMAEVLAADHDGCLPVVFDDAFAYSDPERVIQLQRMLDLAAHRGLQVIVLTCNPSDYAALGAKSILLPPPKPGAEEEDDRRHVPTDRTPLSGPSVQSVQSVVQSVSDR